MEIVSIKNNQAFEFYSSRKKDVSSFFKLKSEYQRLCLNNPIQSRGSHMLKRALYLLFEWIEQNNLLGKVLIDNTIHDEIVCECLIEYSDLVKTNLEKCMIEAGNFYLSELTIKAEANTDSSWGKAK